MARDFIGNTAGGSWSPEYVIGPSLNERSVIAVMPMENLSGTAIPYKEMMKSIAGALKSNGLGVLEGEVLEKFMERHRVRYAGGLTQGLGEAFLQETGTNAVLFLSLDHYDESAPPKIALSARLVSAGRRTVILWMGGVAMAGDDAPGILGIGLIRDPAVLWGKVREKLAGELAAHVAGKRMKGGHESGPRRPGGSGWKYRPKDFYRVPPKPEAGRDTLKIAVLPFSNESTRRHAGEILALHFVRRLSEQRRLEVVEPGQVRQALLTSRTIMEGGLSLPQADLLRVMLGVDLVLTGNVFEYEDYSGPWGAPKVNFTARVYDTKTRQVNWASISYNRGDDGVIFFDAGKVNVAHVMASEMARVLVELMAGSDADAGRRKGP